MLVLSERKTEPFEKVNQRRESRECDESDRCGALARAATMSQLALAQRCKSSPAWQPGPLHKDACLAAIVGPGQKPESQQPLEADTWIANAVATPSRPGAVPPSAAMRSQAEKKKPEAD